MKTFHSAIYVSSPACLSPDSTLRGEWHHTFFSGKFRAHRKSAQNRAFPMLRTTYAVCFLPNRTVLFDLSRPLGRLFFQNTWHFALSSGNAETRPNSRKTPLHSSGDLRFAGYFSVPKSYRTCFPRRCQGPES